MSRDIAFDLGTLHHEGFSFHGKDGKDVNHSQWGSEGVGKLMMQSFAVAVDLVSVLESQIFFQNKSGPPVPTRCYSHSCTGHNAL